MGGIGKTTIAKYLYNENFSRFEGSSFLANVREIAKQQDGLIRLQRQLLSDILNGRKEKIYSVDEGIIKIRDSICDKKVLIVLDDVENCFQLDTVLGMRDLISPGSKIVITTRRKGLLKDVQVCKVYRLEKLDSEESFELFSLHAFGQNHPIDDYMEDSKKVVNHCGGLPLAIKILGSSLSGKTLSIWKSQLKKLKAIPDSEIFEKLRLSYDSLQDDHDKDLFLHVACFFVGKDKDLTKLEMHQLLQEMGKEIVHRESPKEPGERSRLWNSKDSINVLKENMGTQKIEGLIVDMRLLKKDESPLDVFDINRKRRFEEVINKSSLSNVWNSVKRYRLGIFYCQLLGTAPGISNPVVLETDAFSRMRKLKLLQLYHVHMSGSYEKFPKGVRWLCWHGFDFKSIPSDFPLESLVVLDMRYSRLINVFSETKFLELLKLLDLSHSDNLANTPNFSKLPNLERLILIDCARLFEVHESIGYLERLVLLNLKDCKNMRKLPRSIAMLKSLETLDISGCSNLEEFPKQIGNLQSLTVLNVDGITINQSLSTGGEVKAWHSFIQFRPLKLKKTPEICWAALPRSLTKLSLANCNLSEDAFPKDLSNLSSLQFLNLSDNPIQSLPDFIRGFTGLQNLCLKSCTRLQSLVRLPKIKELVIIQNTLLEKITFLSLEPIDLHICWGDLDNLLEIMGMFKVEPIEKVDVEIVNNLGLSNLRSPCIPTVKLYSSFARTLLRKLPLQVEDQLEGGDELNVSVVGGARFQVKEVGVRIVYKEEQEEKSIQIQSTSEAAAAQQTILYGNVVPGTASARPARLSFYRLGTHYVNSKLDNCTATFIEFGAKEFLPRHIRASSTNCGITGAFTCFQSHVLFHIASDLLVLDSLVSLEVCSITTVKSQEASSSNSPCSYHVLLSFRGEDTRKTFTDHLYSALVHAGFRTFRYDDGIERGEDMKSALKKAIQESRISIVVFSKDYASSSWCLDELVMILNRKRMSKHMVLPVFYDVDPSQVRKQMGCFAEAFSRHEERFERETVERKKEGKGKIEGWREALREVANLAGMNLSNQADGYESRFIQKIIKVIGDKLSRTVLNMAPYLIGIHSRSENIQLWLEDESTDVVIAAICGMGGIGKTTIAKYLYNLNFSRFEGSSFLAKGTQKIEGLIVDMRLLKKVDSPLGIFGVNRKRHFEEIINKSSLSNVWNSVKRYRFGIFYCHSLGTAPGLSNLIVLETDAFSRMHKLKLLQLYHVHMSGSFEKFPKRLRWLCWHGFHFKSIPSDFPLESLVALDMPYSTLINVFSETKVLELLKLLDLSHSHNLANTPNFSKLPSIERLILIDCARLFLRFMNPSEHMGKVDVEIVNNLGLSNLKTPCIPTVRLYSSLRTALLELPLQMRKLPLQGCHEKHIFSVYLPGSKVPPWFNVTNIGSSISFVVPSLLNFRIQGLCVCSVYEFCNDHNQAVYNQAVYDCWPHTIISNTTKSLVWSHCPWHFGIPEADENMMWLSYWKFENQLEGGDELKVSVVGGEGFHVKEVGVRIVYEEQEEKSIQIQSTSEAAASQQTILYGNVVPGTVSARPVGLNIYRLGTHFKNCRFCPLPHGEPWTLDDPKSQ
ncbi:disease resistance protein (TIR-NBS-LRR class) family [Actinidia rufa]|uniref:Disease resistance protein (TIR-NBS-LRR class) family n=1 Tax=Actinidia rufa TaxID=165716 RepID=A0A7J0F9C6_9ERIC|nr:disease resistance protein (TIR-NBS-LRR class) family [Actinidia rufa]